MSAGSYPELFLQYFAWGMYNTLWDVFVNLGIVYIPFGFYLYEAYTSTKEKSSHKMNASRVLAYLEMKLFIGIAVLTLAGVPTINMNLTDMKYNKRVCTPGNPTATMVQKSPSGSGTGTTLDGMFTTTNMGGVTAKIPVAWAAVFAVGQSISDGVRIKVPCKTSMKEVGYILSTNTIQDPAVRKEVGLFKKGCFEQARAKLDAETPTTYTSAMQKDGDAGWLGSKFFMSESGYYDKMQPPASIKGFAFDPNGRDKGWWNGDTGTKPQWGRPYCKDWYQNSLRAKILNSIKPTMKTQLLSAFASWDSLIHNTTEAKDVLIRSLINKSDINVINSPESKVEQLMGFGDYSTVDGFGSAGGGLASFGATIGAGLFNGAFYPTMIILKKMLPLVQALVLAGLIMFLPFLLILSQYGIKEVFTMSALIVSIKFWPVIWAVGGWMEASLQEAFMPSLQGLIGGAEKIASINDNVLDYAIGAWYVMGPVVLSTVITMAGYQVGSIVQTAADGNNSGKGAGNEAGGMGKKLTSKVK